MYIIHICVCVASASFLKGTPQKSEAFCSLLCQIGATAGSRQPLSRWLVGNPRVPPPSPPLIPLRLVGEHQGTFWNFFLVTRLSLPFATLQSIFFSCFCMRSTFSIFKDLFTTCFFFPNWQATINIDTPVYTLGEKKQTKKTGMKLASFVAWFSPGYLAQSMSVDHCGVWFLCFTSPGVRGCLLASTSLWQTSARFSFLLKFKQKQEKSDGIWMFWSKGALFGLNECYFQISFQYEVEFVLLWWSSVFCSFNSTPLTVKELCDMIVLP